MDIKLLRRLVCLGALSATCLFANAASANSPMLVDKAGRAIGYFLGSTQFCQSGNIEPVISAQGYIACLDTDTGRIDTQVRTPTSGVAVIAQTYFLAVDCSGAPYLSASADEQFYGGEVVATYHLGLMYLPSSAASQSLVMGGVGAPGVCGGGGSSPLAVIAALSNEFSATGFSSVPYSPPLNVAVLPDSALLDEIFFDHFDDSYSPAT